MFKYYILFDVFAIRNYEFCNKFVINLAAHEIQILCDFRYSDTGEALIRDALI